MRDANSQTRTSLLRRIKQEGSDEVWDEFVMRYREKVFRWCKQRGLQDHDSEDITQETLRKVVAGIGTFDYDRQKGKFRGWLRQVWRSALSDVMRKRVILGTGMTSVHDQLHEVADLHDLLGRLESDFDHEVYEEALARIRDQVSEQTWESFHLHGQLGLSAQEVAERTHTSKGSVKMAKLRVVKRLRAEVQRLNQE